MRLFFAFVFSFFGTYSPNAAIAIDSLKQDVPEKSRDGTHQPPLPMQSPICFKDKNEHEVRSQEIRISVLVTLASMRPYWDPKGLWSQTYLKEHPELETALKEYDQEKRAQSLRGIKLRGKTTQELHEELLDKGFAYYTKPLRVSGPDKKLFWKLDGSTTSNPRDPNVVLQMIYVHSDGSMVRVKPAGVPDKKGEYPRRHPHAIKAVLLKFNRDKCRGRRCAYDTSFANEAFKVNRFNQPTPKSPKESSGLYLQGFKIDANQENLMNYAKDVVMELAHTNLFSKCDVEEVLSEQQGQQQAAQKESTQQESEKVSQQDQEKSPQARSSQVDETKK